MEEDLLGLLGDDKRTAQAPEILLHVERERERNKNRKNGSPAHPLRKHLGW